MESYLKYTEETEPPTLYRTWCGLWALSAALGRRVWAPWEQKVLFPNLYVILVGPSGKVRKGTAIGPSEQLVRSIGVPMAGNVTTFPQLMRRFEECAATHEGYTHHSLGVIAQELHLFLKKTEKDMHPALMDLYDCRDLFSYETKNAGVYNVENVCLNFLGATTPAALPEAFPPHSLEGGMASRCLFIYADQTEKRVNPLTMVVDQTLFKDLEIDLERIHNLHGAFTYHPDMIDLYEDWAAQKFSFNDPRLQPYLSRRPAHVIKISMLMSVAQDSSMVISPYNFVSACEILSAAEAHMERSFSSTGRAANASIIAWIRMELEARKQLHYSQVQRYFMRDCTRAELREIFDGLVAGGEARRQIAGGDEIYYWIGE